MRHSTTAFPMLLSVLVFGCSATVDAPGSSGTGGSQVGSGGNLATGGATSGGTSSGGATATGGSGTVTGGAGGASAGNTGSGGGAGSSGSGNTAGSGPIDYALDCGPDAIVLEAHGPPENRINYIIVGDGYTAADIDGGVYEDHLRRMLDGTGEPGDQDYVAGHFDPESEPYLTYRNFINICALKVTSVDSGVPSGIGGGGKGCPDLAETAFDGCGDDGTRLGYINNQKVYAAVESMLPSTIEMDWVAVVLNGGEWWNSGGIPMVWSGAHPDAALAHMHEGGHGFQRLADEYGGSCGSPPSSDNNLRINVTVNQSTTAGKWTHWLNTTQDPGTGMQGTFEGGQYCNSGVWRPSQESVMNSLWNSAYFNAISLEQGVRILYEFVEPIDSSTPTTVTTPQVLEVKVVDPAVIKVDWSVDGSVVAANGGQTFDVAARGLPSGSHTISARAYDDTPWVPADSPHGREGMEQTVQWTINVP